MDLIEYAKSKIAEYKAEIEKLRNQVAILTRTELKEASTESRLENRLDRIVEESVAAVGMKAKEIAARGRKPVAKRDKTIGQKIIEVLGAEGVVSMSVSHIANLIGEENRSVSYTLQNLKKTTPPKVVSYGGGSWGIARDISTGHAAEDDEEESLATSDNPTTVHYDDFEDRPAA